MSPFSIYKNFFFSIHFNLANIAKSNILMVGTYKYVTNAQTKQFSVITYSAFFILHWISYQMVYNMYKNFEFKIYLNFFFLSHFGLGKIFFEKIDITKSNILYTIWEEIYSRIKNWKSFVSKLLGFEFKPCLAWNLKLPKDFLLGFTNKF